METKTNDLLTNWLRANLEAMRARRGAGPDGHGPLITVTVGEDGQQVVMACRCNKTTRPLHAGYPRYRHATNGRVPIGPGRYYSAPMGTPPPVQAGEGTWPSGWTEIGGTTEKVES
jgi:hypothetical protein